MSPSSDIIIQKCSTFNLRAISALIPRTGLTLVYGPAGSGKSALLQHSLAAESARRLGRIAITGQRNDMLPGITIEESSRGFEINSVAPVVDLTSWLMPERIPASSRGAPATRVSRRVLGDNSNQTLESALGLDRAISTLYSTVGRALCVQAKCSKIGAALVRRGPRAVAEQLVLSAGEMKFQQSMTIAICGVLETDRSLQKAASEAFEAGHRRFVVGEKYFRVPDSEGLKRVLSAIKSGYMPLAVVLKTHTLSEDLSSSALLAELETSLSEAAAEWKKVAVVPRAAVLSSAEGGAFLWESAIYVADGLYQCEGCGRCVVLPTLIDRTLNAKNKVDIDLYGFRFSEIYNVTIGSTGGIHRLFTSLRPDDLELPGVRAASALVSNFINSGLSKIILSQPANSLSTGEKLLLVLSRLISEASTGAIYLLSHSVGSLASGDRNLILSLVDHIVAAGNAVLLEERRVEPFSGLPRGTCLELGPAGGRRGGEVMKTGALVEVGDVGAAKPEGRTRVGKSGRSVLQLERKGVKVEIRAGSLVRITGAIGSGKSILIASLERELVATRRRSSKPKSDDSKVFSESKMAIKWAPDFARSSQLAPFLGSVARRNERFAARLGVEQPIAALYSETPAARRAGLGLESFVFGSIAEQCLSCRGQGEELVDLEPFGRIRRKCPNCGSTGRSSRVLEIEHRGTSFASALNSEVVELLEIFSSRRAIVERLRAAVELDLGHLSLISGAKTFSTPDGVVLDLISLWSDRAASARRARPLVALIDQPVFDRSEFAAVRLTTLLSSLAGEDGLVFYTDPADEFGHPDCQIRL